MNEVMQDLIGIVPWVGDAKELISDVKRLFIMWDITNDKKNFYDTLGLWLIQSP